MTPPDNPLQPPGHRFAEPWHAQILANAQALIANGHLTPARWAEALGAALARAEAAGQPDTEDTYFLAALDALEQVTALPLEALQKRKAEWEAAYRRTPHGKPVLL